jgi:hypothetical protein
MAFDQVAVAQVDFDEKMFAEVDSIVMAFDQVAWTLF